MSAFLCPRCGGEFHGIDGAGEIWCASWDRTIPGLPLTACDWHGLPYECGLGDPQTVQPSPPAPAVPAAVNGRERVLHQLAEALCSEHQVSQTVDAAVQKAKALIAYQEIGGVLAAPVPAEK